MLRRVRKEDVHRPMAQNTERDGLQICLDCWKLWMHKDDRDLSASRVKLNGLDETDEDFEPVGYESDVWEKQRLEDYRIGESTNAMIESLKPCWKWAIYKSCSISTQWRFDKIDYITAAVDAMVDLEIRLRRHFDTGHVFL